MLVGMADPDVTSRADASLIALDWGSTSCRAYLFDNSGAVVESRAGPWGVTQLVDREFAAAFDVMTGDWRLRDPGLMSIASGMIGSAQGWIEVPYRPAPAGAAELARSLVTVPGTTLSIVPGVAQYGDSPNVMRGEETQLIGLLARHTQFSPRARVLLPGTHSKWVDMVDAEVSDFTTFMTGELFAVLKSHSLLGRLARDSTHALTAHAAEIAFARGVMAARETSQGIAPLLFSARALVLTGQLAAEASLEYLSGLLIGDELRSGLAAGGPPQALIGDAMLCARYSVALALCGVVDIPTIDDAAPAGLWEIATRASLTGGDDRCAGVRPRLS